MQRPPRQEVVITEIDLNWSQTWAFVWPVVVCAFVAGAAIALPLLFVAALILGW